MPLYFLCIALSMMIVFKKRIAMKKLILILLAFHSFAEAHLGKIIYLISTPRSCSTIFTRMIHARGDYMIMNEPGVGTYHNIFAPMLAVLGFNENTPTNFSTIQKMILEKASLGHNVFVKDMGFAAWHYLDDQNFLDQQNCTIIFLIRNPHAVQLSFYKKFPHISKITPDILNYKKLHTLYKNLSLKTGKKLYIISAEEITRHPKENIEKLCNHLDISFTKEHLSWENLTPNFILAKEWNTTIYTNIGLNWWGDALKSTQFEQKEYNYALDENGQPTFEEIEDLEHRAFYKKLYKENMPYYQLFLDEYAQQQKMSSHQYDITPSYALTPENVAQELTTIYTAAANKDYIGEAVSQLEHALQSALCALEAYPYDEEIIIAALLHDIGHAYTGKNSLSMDGFGVKNHEHIGAKFLQARGFSEKVCFLVGGHVDAKRYKVFKKPEYHAALSPASQQTLLRQGGPMSKKEAQEFEENHYFKEMLLIRSWDEQAKIPLKTTPSFDYFKEMILHHLQANLSS